MELDPNLHSLVANKLCSFVEANNIDSAFFKALKNAFDGQDEDPLSGN